MIIKLLVTAAVAIVTNIEDSHENRAINPVPILAQISAQVFITTTLLKTISHIMIVTDLVMINIIKTPPHVHFILLAPIIIQPHLVVHINLTLVRVKAPLAIITHLLDAKKHPIALLLNHVLIDIEADLTRTQGIVQIPITNLLSILLNHQFLIFIILPEQNLNSK